MTTISIAEEQQGLGPEQEIDPASGILSGVTMHFLLSRQILPPETLDKELVVQLLQNVV